MRSDNDSKQSCACEINENNIGHVTRLLIRYIHTTKPSQDSTACRAMLSQSGPEGKA